MSTHHDLSNFIWSIADLLRGPYRPPQYERVMLPLVALRRFDCVLDGTKDAVLAECAKYKGKYQGDALDGALNRVSGQRFHNHSPLSFEKLRGDPDNAHLHLVFYINGFSENVRKIFERFEFGNEIERMREHNILFLVIKKFYEIDLHPNVVNNIDMGLLFEDLICRFNEQANETAGDHFTPREVIRLMVHLLFMHDDELLTKPGTVRKLLDPNLKQDVEQYFEREVLPHVPDAWIDHEKTKVGYEINFNRHFYRFTPPRPLAEIDADLKRAEDEILRLLSEVTA